MNRLAVFCSLLFLAGACASAPQVLTLPGGTSAGETAAILTALNEAEIAQGQLAASRAAGEGARSLGQMMVADHTANLERGRAIFSRLGVTATDNDISRSLRETAARASNSLQTYSGPAFDRTFARAQADMHQWALNALDVAMIPSTTNRELRDYLTATRASIAAHLEHARNVR